MELDVRGTKITVGKKTLGKVKGSKLWSLVYGHESFVRTSEGRIFIDRNPEMFNHVLNYIQSDQTFLPRDVTQDTKSLIHLELQYWGFSIKDKMPIRNEIRSDEIKQRSQVLE